MLSVRLMKRATCNLSFGVNDYCGIIFGYARSVLKIPDGGVLVCGSYRLTWVIESAWNRHISWLPDFPARQDVVCHLS